MATNVERVFVQRMDGTIKPVAWRSGVTVRRVLVALNYTEQEIAAIESQLGNVSIGKNPLPETGLDTVLNAGDMISILPSVKGA